MSVIEHALTFHCAGEQLLGIFSEPAASSKLGVLVVVGGPQYRVGCHRQFVSLARRLADGGIPVMRFDYRGMGDSSGEAQTFQEIVPDIAAAISAFKAACPSLDQVVLWGLCDGASACLLYWHATADSHLAGIVLLNPWISTEEKFAKAQIRHSLQRLLQRDFWMKVAGGKIDVAGALRKFTRAIVAARAGRDSVESRAKATFQERMALAMGTFSGPILLVLSGRDLTVMQFLEYCRSDPRWRDLIERANVERRDLPDADHTFSTAIARQELEALTVDWIKRSLPTEPHV